MKSKLLFLPVIVLLLSIIFSSPAKTTAEVATGHDWLGLFVVYTADPWENGKSDTVGGNKWFYTADTDTGPACSTSSQGPFLKGMCTFTGLGTLPPGAYEFRLNANTKPTDPLTFDAAMIAQSKVVWKPMVGGTSTEVTAVCVQPDNDKVRVSWPDNLVGVTKIQVYRDGLALPSGLVDPLPNTYIDNTILKNIKYSWHIVAQTTRGATQSSNVITDVGCTTGGFPTDTPPPTFTPVPPTPTITPQPWIKTSGGDVHINQ